MFFWVFVSFILGLKIETFICEYINSFGVPNQLLSVHFNLKLFKIAFERAKKADKNYEIVFFYFNFLILTLQLCSVGN